LFIAGPTGPITSNQSTARSNDAILLMEQVRGTCTVCYASLRSIQVMVEEGGLKDRYTETLRNHGISRVDQLLGLEIEVLVLFLAF
jgi:hypothetical protein